MKPLFTLFSLTLTLLISFNAQAQESSASSNPMVIMATNQGNMTIELYADKAPITVKNFMEYADSGFYNGTIFHRVIPQFVIQGGGFTATMEKKETRAPIVNEGNNGLRNLRGTLSMARLPDPNSATSQFFINLRDNRSLDANGPRAGYAVFGKVVEGINIMERIASKPTGNVGPYRDVPIEPIEILSVKAKPAEQAAAPAVPSPPTAVSSQPAQ
jgi:cyclophilin family peptidyl-prolyl cis-trans isomerase